MNRIEAWEELKAETLERVVHIRDELAFALSLLNHASANLELAQSKAPAPPNIKSTCTCGADIHTQRLLSDHVVVNDYHFPDHWHCPKLSSAADKPDTADDDD